MPGIRLLECQARWRADFELLASELRAALGGDALRVRDFLRHDHRTAEAYGRLKSRLAVALADPKTDPDVKDPAADLIDLAAERWALETNWQQAGAGSG